jgi:hypothetical protein
MSRKGITVLLAAELVAVATCAVGALLITRAAPELSIEAEVPVQQSVSRSGRNLSLQPEALRVSRRLGKRFQRSSRAVASSAGTLTLAGNQGR